MRGGCDIEAEKTPGEGHRRGVRRRVGVCSLLGVCGAERPLRGVLGHEAARDTEREQGERWADVAGA